MQVGQGFITHIAVVMLVNGIVTHRNGSAIEWKLLVIGGSNVLRRETYQAMDAATLTKVRIPWQMVRRGILVRGDAQMVISQCGLDIINKTQRHELGLSIGLLTLGGCGIHYIIIIVIALYGPINHILFTWQATVGYHLIGRPHAGIVAR